MFGQASCRKAAPTSISLTRGLCLVKDTETMFLSLMFYLFRSAVSSDLIFMDDNAPCHRTFWVDDFLQTESIQRMSWPAISSDLRTCMGYTRETVCRSFALTKLRSRTEKCSPICFEMFEPSTHSSSHNRYGKSLFSAPSCLR